MINHLPIFAPVLAIPLLLLAYWKREEKAIIIGAVLLLVFGAVGGIVSTLSGEEAEQYVEGEPGVSMKALSIHEERAEVAAVTLDIVAILALAALLAMWKRPGMLKPEYWITLLLVGAFVASAMAGFAALKGGEIRHPEIRPPESAEFLQVNHSDIKSADVLMEEQNVEDADENDDD